MSNGRGDKKGNVIKTGMSRKEEVAWAQERKGKNRKRTI
jgi:hypothetical protein